MTHDEIKKALDCCMNRQCSKCPLYEARPFCIEKLHYRLRDVLVANDKEIKRLKEIEYMYNDLCK